MRDVGESGHQRVAEVQELGLVGGVGEGGAHAQVDVENGQQRAEVTQLLLERARLLRVLPAQWGIVLAICRHDAHCVNSGSKVAKIAFFDIFKIALFSHVQVSN